VLKFVSLKAAFPGGTAAAQAHLNRTESGGGRPPGRVFGRRMRAGIPVRGIVRKKSGGRQKNFLSLKSFALHKVTQVLSRRMRFK
jgi:hypothetical protein